MTDRESYTDVACTIKAAPSNGKALLIADKHGEEFWVPRSVCMNGHHEFNAGDDVMLKIAAWFVVKNEIGL